VSTNAITPVSWSIASAAPSWLMLQDNGNGTATLSGTPPPGTTGTFNTEFLPFAANSIGLDQLFPITVLNTPVFTSPNTATFTVGSQEDFNISANLGTITGPGSLPAGLSFDAGGNTAKINGTPAAGTGGPYQLTLTDNAGTNGTVTQTLYLNVYEAPQIKSPGLVVFLAGQPASVEVTATGFPGSSTHVVPANSGPPTSPSEGNGTYFTVNGLPSSLTASNLSSLGYATGTLTISGTPQASDVGTHSLQITAQNAVGTPAQQTLTLEIYPTSTSASVNLVTSFQLSRDASNNVVATVVVANNGGTAAQDVAITSAKIGSVAGTISSAAVASIAPASTATFSVVFPAASMGAKGTAGVLTLSGTYTGGTFSSGGRLVLP
jgi:hypothetical protein